MDIKRINALYFSPTGGTKNIAAFVAEEIAQRMGLRSRPIDFTKPENRRRDYQFGADELLVIAVPVYAGRVPNKLLPDLSARLMGSGTPAAPICVFGNRSPDEALRELALLLDGNGFHVAGAAAFVCCHAFSDHVGTGRPDEEDQAQMQEFAAQVADKLTSPGLFLPLELDRGEIGPYYTPLKADGTPAKFLKAKPQTDWGRCIHCGLCAEVCPMGSISADTAETEGICIKCQACVRQCPVRAKHFTDADFLSHVAMLEQNYGRRAKNVVLI